MTSYKVLCENLTGKNPGDTVTDEELDGMNIAALIAGGHIEPTTKTKKDTE